MRLDTLIFAGLLLAGPAAAGGQTPPGLSPAASAQSQTQDAPELNLPVDLDTIRERVARPPALRGLDRRPDYSVTIEIEQRLQEMFRSLELKLGPPPPGGLYAYEQQRLLFNPTDAPLAQPFAQFSGGQLLTLAIEALVGRWVVGKVSGAQRSRAERLAREEVSRAIADFCAKQPDRARIELCWMGTDR
jgi:hypothetical protein